MIRRARSAAWLMVVPLCVSACSDADSAPREAAAGEPPAAGAAVEQVVAVAAMDYAFEAPAEIAPGWTTFRFTNRGPEPHHLTLVKLEEGRTVADVVNAMREMRPLTGIASAVGGPNAPMPGAEAVASVNLTPGEYALICVVPSPDGTMHVLKGMVKPITVRQGEPGGVVPDADLEIRMQDYTFAVAGQIAAGERTIRVVNDAGAVEPHEIVLARLAPGATAEELNSWIHAMNGPPPAEFIGGITALDPGQSGTFTADFTPGEYAILCPLPSGDGQAHTYKGMMHQFTVQ